MRPEAALELVGKYARLQRRINLIKTEIGQALDPCPWDWQQTSTMFDDESCAQLRQCDDAPQSVDGFERGWIAQHDGDYWINCPPPPPSRRCASRNDRLAGLIHPPHKT